MGPQARLCVAMLLLSTVVLSTNMADPDTKKMCNEYGQPCHGRDDCCGGCCQQSLCVPFSEACVAPDPCRLHDCVPPKTCYLQQVECLQSPCQPIAACRDPDYNDYN